VLIANSSKVCEDSWKGVQHDSWQPAYNWTQTDSPVALHWVMWQQALTEVISISSNRQSGWNLGKQEPGIHLPMELAVQSIHEEVFHLKGAVWVIWQPKGRQGLRSRSRTFSKGHSTRPAN
jgi:hypothetical protein